jgi:hypothetical protein
MTSVILLGGIMLRTQTTIPVPSVNEKTPLSSLSYKPRRFEASITSVTLKIKSEAGVDPVVADWVFTGSNTDGQVHRVEVQISPRDEGGKRLGWFTAKHPLPAGAQDQTFVVPMKMKADAWSAVKNVHIAADWMS